MATNLISKIDGKWVHDAHSIHTIYPTSTNTDCSTFTVQIADPTSNKATTTILTLPNAVMLKDMADALVYKGALNASEPAPGTAIPASRVGYTYKVATSGYIANVKVEPGDMIICNTKTTTPTTTDGKTKFDYILSNLDPDLYSLKGHQHTVSVQTTTSASGGFTPTGTIGITLNVGTTTFTGSYTPEGTISAPSITNTLTSTSFGYVSNVSATYTTVTVGDFVTGYTYSTATEELVFSTVSVKYDKTNVIYSTSSTGNILTNVTSTSSIPTFYGTPTTLSVSGTPTVTATSTFYGDAVAAHAHNVSCSTISTTDLLIS